MTDPGPVATTPPLLAVSASKAARKGSGTWSRVSVGVRAMPHPPTVANLPVLPLLVIVLSHSSEFNSYALPPPAFVRTYPAAYRHGGRPGRASGLPPGALHQPRVWRER